MILLQGMLLYPEKFLRLINEYYNRRRTCVSPAMRERLAAAAKEELNGVRLKKYHCGRLLGEHAKSKSGFRLVRTEE